MIQQHVYDHIRSSMVADDVDNVDFSDRAFAYDYNEVQELFFDEKDNNYVILAGKTGLRKKDMIGRISKDLQLRGIPEGDILYLDYECPIIWDADPLEVISRFVIERHDSNTLYLLINEVQEMGDWFGFLSTIKDRYDHIRVLSSSSTPPYIYQKMYDTGCDFCRVVVLSEKNDSNIKYETTTFGVFEEFKYNIKNGVVEIKGLTKEGKKMPSHKIPDEIDGIPVRIISSGAFHDRKEMHKIEIPPSVSMIGDYAFSKCSGLDSIVLPNGLRYIGDHAFLGASTLRNIEGGENVEHIGNSAFYGTPWVDGQGDFVTLGHVLYRYKGDDDVVRIPEKVKVLAPYSFADTHVINVIMPDSVYLEEGVFFNCHELEIVNFDSNNVSAFTFYGCGKLRSIHHIHVAGNYAFHGCRSLEAVSVEETGTCSFSNCVSLKKIDSLKVAGKGSFWECRNLSEVNLSDVSYIGECSFGRTQLTTIDTDANCIGNYAFIDCVNVSKVSIGDSSIIGRRILFRCDSVSIMSIPGREKVMWYFGQHPAKLTRITVIGDICDDFCRNCHSLVELTLKDVGKFGRWSFYNNDSLSHVSMDNVDNIGDWSFAHCDKLCEITLPNTIRYIGMNAFRYCNNLKTIILQSDDPIEFGPNAFYSTHPSKSFLVKEGSIEPYSRTRIWEEYISCFKVEDPRNSPQDSDYINTS